MTNAMTKRINQGFIPVANAEDLNNIRENKENIFGKGTEFEGEYMGGLDKKYIQIRNIKMDKFTDFKPIGERKIEKDGSIANRAFTGEYFGLNTIISRLYINTGNPNSGLFGYVDGASIIGVELLDDCRIIGVSTVGGIAGYANNSLIKHCKVGGGIYGQINVGGIVGLASDTHILGCKSNVDMATMSNTGGIVGNAINDTIISRCDVLGNIKSEDSTGGIVGSASNTKIDNSYNKADIISGDGVGGIVGACVSDVEIINCDNYSSISGSGSVGAFVGIMIGKNTIRNSESYGRVRVK